MSTRIIALEDFQKICRFCLTPKDLVPIKNVAIGGLDLTTIIDKSIALEMYDQSGKLPMNTCRLCAKKLNGVYNFKKQCYEIDSLLRLMTGQVPGDNVFTAKSTPSPNTKQPTRKPPRNSTLIVTPKPQNQRIPEETELQRKPLQDTHESQPKASPIPNVDVLVTGKQELEGTPEIKYDYIVPIEISSIESHPKFSPIPDDDVLATEEPELDRPSSPEVFEIKTDSNPPIEISSSDDDEDEKEAKHENVVIEISQEPSGPVKRRRINPKAFPSIDVDGVTIVNKPKKKVTQIRSFGPPFICPQCPEDAREQFPTRNELYRHKKKVHFLKRCPICSKLLRMNMEIHIRSHTGERPFICDQCPKTYRRAIQLKEHMRIHTGEYPYMCEKCGKRFTVIGRMRQHEKHCQNMVGDVPTEGDLMLCNVCGISFQRYGCLVRHIGTHNLKPEDAAAITPSSKFICEECGKFYSSLSSLKNHLNVHSKRNFRCEPCDKEFPNSISFGIHKQAVHPVNHPRNFVCSTCNKRFRSRSSLRIHFNIHTGLRPFKCRLCPMTFRQISHLSNHSRTHTGEQPYSCKFCGRRFSGKGNLAVHLRIHTGEKPYKCSVCAKGFYASNTRKKHELTHLS